MNVYTNLFTSNKDLLDFSCVSERDTEKKVIYSKQKPVANLSVTLIKNKEVLKNNIISINNDDIEIEFNENKYQDNTNNKKFDPITNKELLPKSNSSEDFMGNYILSRLKEEFDLEDVKYNFIEVNDNKEKNETIKNKSKDELTKPIQKGNYIMENNIGEGAFGKVKKGYHISTKQEVAIKILDKTIMNQEEGDFIRVMKEITILKKLRHKNIVQLYEIIESSRKLYLVMELCNKELFDYIVENQKLDEYEACKFFQDLIDAVEYLHIQSVVHRDLKPENLLLDENKNLKLTDFGLSTIYGEDLLNTPCGTPSYAPPEMLKGESYHGMLSDIWSCGVILYAMVCGYLPFSESNEDLNCKNIVEGNFEIPNSLSPLLINLLNGILRTNPLERYDISQVKDDPWFNLITPRCIPGLIIGLHEIPIDNDIIDIMLSQFSENKRSDEAVNNLYSNDNIEEGEKMSLSNLRREDVIEKIVTNKFDNITATYYLLVKQKNKNGVPSVSDLQSDLYIDHISLSIQNHVNENEEESDKIITSNSFKDSKQNNENQGENKYQSSSKKQAESSYSKNSQLTKHSKSRSEYGDYIVKLKEEIKELELYREKLKGETAYKNSDTDKQNKEKNIKKNEINKANINNMFSKEKDSGINNSGLTHISKHTKKTRGGSQDTIEVFTIRSRLEKENKEKEKDNTKPNKTNYIVKASEERGKNTAFSKIIENNKSPVKNEVRKRNTPLNDLGTESKTVDIDLQSKNSPSKIGHKNKYKIIQDNLFKTIDSKPQSVYFNELNGTCKDGNPTYSKAKNKVKPNNTTTNKQLVKSNIKLEGKKEKVKENLLNKFDLTRLSNKKKPVFIEEQMYRNESLPKAFETNKKKKRVQSMSFNTEAKKIIMPVNNAEKKPKNVSKTEVSDPLSKTYNKKFINTIGNKKYQVLNDTSDTIKHKAVFKNYKNKNNLTESMPALTNNEINISLKGSQLCLAPYKKTKLKVNKMDKVDKSTINSHNFNSRQFNKSQSTIDDSNKMNKTEKDLDMKKETAEYFKRISNCKSLIMEFKNNFKTTSKSPNRLADVSQKKSVLTNISNVSNNNTLQNNIGSSNKNNNKVKVSTIRELSIFTITDLQCIFPFKLKDIITIFEETMKIKRISYVKIGNHKFKCSKSGVCFNCEIYKILSEIVEQKTIKLTGECFVSESSFNNEKETEKSAKNNNKFDDIYYLNFKCYSGDINHYQKILTEVLELIEKNKAFVINK